MPALQLLAYPGDDARHLVLEDAENLLLPHVCQSAFAGVRMSRAELARNTFRRMVKVLEVLDRFVNVAEDAMLEPA
eukprot:11032401-Alexandrium_andersonii.AAC.1